MSSAQSLVTWSTEFSLGLPEIDEQHQALFGLINHVWVAVVNKAPPEETLRVVEELEKYTLTHFTAEETFMRVSGYAEFDGHKAAHEKFVARVAAEKATVAAGKHMSLDIVHFLKDWLIDHILVSDKAYAEVYKRRSEPASSLGKFFKRFWG